MAQCLAGFVLLIAAAGCARPNRPITQTEPAAPVRASAPPSAAPAPLASAAPSIEMSPPAPAPSASSEPAPLASGAPVSSASAASPSTSSSDVPPLANPWLGLTQAEVRAWVNGPSAELGQGRGVSLYGGARQLQITAKGWSVEWLPGGCSDWYWSVKLRFERGRVVDAQENRRARYSGRYCN